MVTSEISAATTGITIGFISIAEPKTRCPINRANPNPANYPIIIPKSAVIRISAITTPVIALA